MLCIHDTFLITNLFYRVFINKFDTGKEIEKVYKKLNSVVQQPVSAKAGCAQPILLSAIQQLCRSDGQSDAELEGLLLKYRD